MPEIGFCEDCTHWQPPNKKMGVCLKTIDDYREGVGIMTNHGWESGMYTGPKFGCVHFEDLPEKELQKWVDNL